MTNKSLPMPITVKPYHHQQQAFDFACMRFGLLPSDFRSNGVALLMEMGTGKTITSIGISGILYQFGRVNRILVVAPLSILGVWEEEFEKFAAFPYTLTILKGTSAKKRQQLSEVGKTDGLEIVVVNYESARILEPELLKFNADLIIADEGHKLKENRSQQSKTMHTLGDHARYKLLLTGTLITNREIDAYAVVRGGVKDRAEEVRRFQNDDDCRVFIGQIAAAGLGITLTAASTMVFYSLDYSMSNFDQAKARIHRVGQRENCHYIYLIARGTVDRKILRSLRDKIDLAKTLVDDYRKGKNPFRV